MDWGKPFRRPEGELEPIEPITEERAPHIPYRGGMFHGVTPPDTRLETLDSKAVYVDTESIEPEPKEEAVPVRIVQGNDSSERRDTRVTRLDITNSPQRVLSEDPTRVSAKIKNGSPDKSVVFWNDGSSFENGYPIAPGASEEVKGIGSFHAQCTTADIVPIHVLIEFTRG